MCQRRTTIDSLNTHFEVGAGGFMGATNPSYVYSFVDDAEFIAGYVEAARRFGVQSTVN